MRYAEVVALAIASLVGSASFPERANAQHVLDRLFLDPNNRTPLRKVFSFDNEAQVADFYGVRSLEASLAARFFAGYNGSSAHMLFARFPVGGARARLFGSNIRRLKIEQLQAINGSLSITSQGYQFSTSIDLSGVASFAEAAGVIKDALNERLPVPAVATECSIAPASAFFTGSVRAAVLYVTEIQSGSIQNGSILAGPGVPAGTQVVSQISGKPNGIGTYAIFYRQGHQVYVTTDALTATYGVLTIGSVGSGAVAIGQQVSDAVRGVLPYTAIQSHLSGSGAGSTWVVNKAQTVAKEAMTMTAAPLDVVYRPINGRTLKSGAFWIEQNGNFTFASSSMTYAGGTAAGALGLTQPAGAYLSSPGQVVAAPSRWLDDFVRATGDDWTSFQTTFDPDAGASPPTYKNSLAAWSQGTSGRHTYVGAFNNTTTIDDSVAPGDE